MRPAVFEARLNHVGCFVFMSPTMIVGRVEFRRLSSLLIIKVFLGLLYT